MMYLHQQLQSNHYPNCSRVAEYFEVSSKSIRRDVDYMRDLLHAPIEYNKKKRGYYYDKLGWDFLPSLRMPAAGKLHSTAS